MSHRGHRAGTSAGQRYLNGRIMEQQGEEPDATAGLLQHAGSGLDDDDDTTGVETPTVEIRASVTMTESSAANGHRHRHGSGVNGSAAGNQLNASGTEISLDGPSGKAAPTSGAGHATSGAAGGGSGVKITGSSTVSLKTAWKLKYQDFLPDKKGAGAVKFDPVASENFQKLVDRANEWLDKNREVKVKTCQTMEWMSHDPKRLGSGEQMVLSKNFSDNSTTYYVRGLRLWLVPRTQARRHQTISFTDFTPDNPTDTIKHLIAKINRKIETKQFKGQTLTVETISTPIINGKLDCRITRWTESIVDDSPYAFTVRVFHCRHPDGNHASKHSNVIDSAKIDVRDVIPQATTDGYEGFEDLVERTNTWLKDQTDILVINMQSIMVLKDDSGPHSETGNSCRYVVPGLNSANPVDFFRIMRVAYRQLPQDSTSTNELDIPVIYPFTYETFTPELVRVGASANAKLSTGGSQKERLETMNETFAKVIAFLQNSGADVICAETVANPMQLFATDSSHALSGPDEIQFLLTIRLFLTGQIGRVDGSIASIKRASIVSSRGATRSSPSAVAGQTDRPGPIFLRNVVSRQFKYRWLVLAISAFFCMTVIVILSVVYSNR